jgi:hypothetical protein
MGVKLRADDLHILRTRHAVVTRDPLNMDPNRTFFVIGMARVQAQPVTVVARSKA